MNAFCIDCEFFNDIEKCDQEVEPFDKACVCFVQRREEEKLKSKDDWHEQMKLDCYFCRNH